MFDISYKKLCFTLFPKTLRNEMKIWKISLDNKEVRTWKQLIEKLMKTFFTHHENAMEGHYVLSVEG